ncbi:MFS transporter [Pseudonocardiaceae bacterium YIM PH 21723]|nr:MFS transporter [Pseudonocardiaceae bacterium YIM PH 21723]
MGKNSAILLLAIGHSCVDVYQGTVAALVPYFIADRAYTYAAASGIVLAASLLSSVTQPLFGLLTDRRHMPWLLPASTLLGGLGIALSGLGDSYPLTLVCMAVSGIGIAAYHPEAARLARLASRGDHGRMSWFITGGNLGFLAAPGLVALTGLRYAPLLVIPAVLGCLLCLFAVRHLPARPTAGAKSTVDVPDDRRSFVKLVVVVMCRAMVFIGLTTFIALYARERGLNGTVALSLTYVGALLGPIIGARLADRFGRIRVVRAAVLLTIPCVAAVIFLPGPGLYPAATLAGIALYLVFALQVTLGQDYLPSRVGTASGITLGLGVTVGGLASPVLGALADAYTLQIALVPLMGLPLLAWVLLRTMPEPVAAVAALAVPAGSRR